MEFEESWPHYLIALKVQAEKLQAQLALHRDEHKSVAELEAQLKDIFDNIRSTDHLPWSKARSLELDKFMKQDFVRFLDEDIEYNSYHNNAGSPKGYWANNEELYWTLKSFIYIYIYITFSGFIGETKKKKLLDSYKNMVEGSHAIRNLEVFKNGTFVIKE